MSVKVAAGLLRWWCDAALRRYGVARRDMLDAALLDEADLADPSTLVPAQALADLLRFLLARTGDPGLGLELAATPLDLRTQGFWGYALLSSLTLRQQIELQVRYHALRSPVRHVLREEAGLVSIEFQVLEMPADVEPVLVDWGLAAGVQLMSPHLRSPGLRIWLTYSEQPHHAPLRALLGASIVFDAARYRVEVPAADLDVRRSDGDPHLEKLACAQLDGLLAAQAEHERAVPSLLETVRARLAARLHGDASLPRVARDLRIAARTLQRQLDNLGASFHELLEEARQTRAVEYLVGSDEAIEHIALRLGYADPSSFRRAFRRWTGVSPGTFRAQRRGTTQLRASS